MKEQQGEVVGSRWDYEIEAAWGAVPAMDLLVADAPLWPALKLGPIPKDEAATFGLIGRLLKYGQSLAVALPLLGGDTVPRLMAYLHRLRFDAMEGGLRTPWLNPSNMERRPDVVFICRPRSRLQEFSRVPDIHAHILRPAGKQHGSGGNRSQTLLIDGSGDLMELVDLISKDTRPFVIVVDATVGGTDGAEQLDGALFECFSDTPRLVLLSLGDNETVSKVRAGRSDTHLWVMRLEDRKQIDPAEAHVQRMRLGKIEDQIANAAMESAFARLFELRRVLDTARDPVLKKKLSILGKVFRGLNELVVPLNRLEATLQNATRPGLFPVRSLERWLAVAGQDSCQYGETQMKTAALLAQLSTSHGLLMRSVTGKAALLHSWIKCARRKQRQIMVLCGNTYEVAALGGWLDETLDPGWAETTHIVAMDGVKSYRQQRLPMDEVIVAGMLWPSRQHWLATPCKTMTIITYPYEAAVIERLLSRWWKSNGNASQPSGDKYRLWSLDWGNSRCLDIDTDCKIFAVDTEICPNLSEYPPRTQQVIVPVTMEHEDWLEHLMSEPDEPNFSAVEGDVLNRELAWISTHEHDLPLPWAQTRPVLVLKNNDIVPTLPAFLEQGDQIILLKQTEERLATQEKLFELVVSESEGMQQLISAANRWQIFVDKVASKYRPYQVQPYLQKEGVNVGDAAIANWYSHGVYGPRDRAAVLVFARLAEVNEPEKAARYTSNGIERVRHMHQEVGRQLRKALLERSKGATEIVVGTLHLEASTFNEMIEMATVEEVRLPTTQVVAGSVKAEGLSQIAEEIMRQYPRRLHFTTPAMKSMRDSVYRDLDKFRVCVSRMASELYFHYKDKKSRLHEVLEGFKNECIDFEPKMSSVTMGQFGDRRKYKHRDADMNRHFCLGNARDKTRTLRIHFEWDDEDSLIVIHHAGEHLTTTQS